MPKATSCAGRCLLHELYEQIYEIIYRNIAQRGFTSYRNKMPLRRMTFFCKIISMKNSSYNHLTRQLHPIPDDIRDALLKNNLCAAYRSRPPYQQNDYVGWITRAKRQVTRDKRLRQMLAELAGGMLYMKMPWKHGGRGNADKNGD
jgi:hypothetical protein